jgi:adenylate cyclase class 2
MTGPIETEIKIPIEDGAGPARLLIEERGYRMTAPRTLQADQVFDFPDRALRESGRLLRLRSESGRAILTYKGPVLSAGLHKSREELETSAADGGMLEQILGRLGFVPSFRYEKYRTTFQAPAEPGLVALDETPIGVFLELEGPGDWIDRTAQRLGFAPRNYVIASYAALYRDFLKLHQGPPDMLFSEGP